MKTTIDIADAVLNEAKDLARERNTTLRALVEEGLRLVLEQHRESAPESPFKLRMETFRGNGLQPGIDLSDWDTIRDIIYDREGLLPDRG